MATKAADQLVSVLMDWQVKHVFGLPGDSIDTTVDVYGANKIRSSSFRYVMKKSPHWLLHQRLS